VSFRPRVSQRDGDEGDQKQKADQNPHFVCKYEIKCKSIFTKKGG
jgi:hypothetical protein